MSASQPCPAATLPDQARRGAGGDPAPGAAGAPAAFQVTPSMLFRTALWGGIVYGFVEALVVVALSLVPGGLAWYTGNSADVLWFAPLFYLVVAVPIAVVFAALAFLFPKRPIDVALVALMTIGGAFTCGQVPPAVIAQWAIAILALGIGVQCTRFYRARRAAAAAFMARTLPWMVAVLPAVWIAVAATGALRERSAMGRLGDAPPGGRNVLVLVLDTQRADHLSSYGYERQTTPRIDAFAREGRLFEAAYSNSSWTLPSMASLLTGRLPQVHGAGVMRRPYLDRKFPTLAEEFARRGYATGGFVANGWWCGRQTGLDRGFIRFRDFYGSLGDAVVRTQLGRVYGNSIRPWFGAKDVLGRKRVGDVNREFLGWLDEIGDRPFFAFLNYVDVHAPYVAPAPYAGTFSSGDEEEPDEGGINIGAIHGAMPKFIPAQYDAMRDAYDESLLSLDAGIGDLLDDLRRRGLLDDTVVVLTADHGESFGEQGMVWHGHSLHVEQIHVPLIVRCPPVVTGGVRDAQPVDLSRLPASVATLAGISDAPFGGAVFPGAPGAPDGDDHPAESAVARRSQVPGPWPTSRASLTSVATKRWLLVLADGKPAELFDLAADPKGLVNVIDIPENAATIETLRARASGGW